MTGAGQGGTDGRWSDLRTRVLSAVALVALGGAALVLGGPWLMALIACAIALIQWEIWTMLHPARPAEGAVMAALSASALAVALGLPFGAALIPIAITALAGAALASRDRHLVAAFAIGTMLAGWGLYWMRAALGLDAILWLVALVVASDVLGYFAGKSLGGPKFWPQVSPKKTWSGTIAGWVGAAFVGLIVAATMGGGWIIVVISVLAAFAGQLGDIAESALKRHAGVKDSSALIPGHGGVYDRFDALLAAALFLLFIVMTTGLGERFSP